MKNIKAMGLMSQVAKGLLNHSGSATAAQLGDRSLYVGLSDIGKGAECLEDIVHSFLPFLELYRLFPNRTCKFDKLFPGRLIGPLSLTVAGVALSGCFE